MCPPPVLPLEVSLAGRVCQRFTISGKFSEKRRKIYAWKRKGPHLGGPLASWQSRTLGPRTSIRGLGVPRKAEAAACLVQ